MDTAHALRIGYFPPLTELLCAVYGGQIGMLARDGDAGGTIHHLLLLL